MACKCIQDLTSILNDAGNSSIVRGIFSYDPTRGIYFHSYAPACKTIVDDRCMVNDISGIVFDLIHIKCMEYTAHLLRAFNKYEGSKKTLAHLYDFICYMYRMIHKPIGLACSHIVYMDPYEDHSNIVVNKILEVHKYNLSNVSPLCKGGLLSDFCFDNVDLSMQGISHHDKVKAPEDILDEALVWTTSVSDLFVPYTNDKGKQVCSVDFRIIDSVLTLRDALECIAILVSHTKYMKLNLPVISTAPSYSHVVTKMEEFIIVRAKDRNLPAIIGMHPRVAEDILTQIKLRMSELYLKSSRNPVLFRARNVSTKPAEKR